MSKNITIPLSLFYKIIDCLDCWDASDFDPLLRHTYIDVIFALDKKRQSIELRHAYAKIINADDDVNRHHARMQYLLQKRELNRF
jgi:hypothetical protein